MKDVRGALTTTIVTDTEAFGRLGEQWDRLVDDCASATPFVAHAWLTSWWQSYGVSGRLRVVGVYLDGELVGAAAFHLSGQLPVRTLMPLGAGLSDYSDILVADSVGSRRAEVVRSLGSALRDLHGWDVLDLPEVRPGAAAFELVEQWRGPTSRTEASTCLELPVEDVLDLAARLPQQTGRKQRRKLRTLDEAGVSSHVVAAEDVAEALVDFHRLHTAQWQGRGINPEHARPRFHNFLAAALPIMVKRRQALVTSYYLDGELRGVAVNLVSKSMMGGYLAGVSPTLREHVDVATLLLRHTMELAQQYKVPVLSLLRGAEDYKLRWRPETVVSQRLVLGRTRSPRALAFLAAANGRARALPLLRERAPWLKNVRDEARRRLSTWYQRRR